MNKKRERITLIVNTLKSNNAASIRELAHKFDVSEMTIRRDLNILAQDNIIKLMHGGAVLYPNSRRDNKVTKYLLTEEGAKNAEEKMRIGQKAASLIEPNDIIIVDSGSTTEYFARNIPDEMPITVLCYALNILVEIHRKKKCRLTFAGGYFHDNTLMFESPEGIELIKRYRANKAFISASGINEKLGITCANLYESETKKAALKSSLSRILLADSTKFEKIRNAYFADLNDFDIIITDTGISAEYTDIITDLGIKLYTV